MTDEASPSAPGVGSVTVRYWAAARAAAGVESDLVPVRDCTTLADVLDAVRALHHDPPRLADAAAVRSVPVGDGPVGKADPAQLVLSPGDTLELLPPFAGG